jgi:hypothetical protein
MRGSVVIRPCEGEHTLFRDGGYCPDATPPEIEVVGASIRATTNVVPELVGMPTKRGEDVVLADREFGSDRPGVEALSITPSRPHRVVPVEGHVERREMRRQDDVATTSIVSLAWTVTA